MSAAGRTVRVFVSSTFRDMHAERDYLNRQVFPELRQRCLARGAEFVAVDLRWGLTEEQTDQRGAVRLCLDEIDLCRPFFVALVGDRYGWVPPPEEVAGAFFDQVRHAADLPAPAARLLDRHYQSDPTCVPPVYRLRRDRPDDLRRDGASLVALWCRAKLPDAHLSVTVREIRRALAGGRFAHSLFYVRQPGPAGITSHPDFPAAFAPIFRETVPTWRRLAESLREKLADLHAKSGAAVRAYTAEYAGVRLDPALLPADFGGAGERANGLLGPGDWRRLSPDVREAVEKWGTVRLDGLTALGEMVLDDLWRAIEVELAKTAAGPAAADPHDRDRGGHERFARDRTRLFFGRRAALDRLHPYRTATDPSPFVVSGPPGSGKSALLARFVEESRSRSPGQLVVPHFIGAVPGTTRLLTTLRSLLETLRRAGGPGPALPDDPRLLRGLLAAELERVGAGRPLLLVIDALDQLDPAERAHSLDWLPVRLPAGVRVVVSTLPGACADELRRRADDAHWLELGGLGAADRRSLVREHLRLRGKRLTDPQLAALLDLNTRPQAALPLYLVVALEELCLFGSFEALDERLGRLPPAVPELFTQVLERLEQDHGPELVTAVCGALAASRSGLAEAEVLDLLRRQRPGLAHAHWRRLYRALQFYLRPADESTGDGLIAFFHEQLRAAVLRRHLGMAPGSEAGETCRRVHAELAEVFESVARCGDSRRWRREQPRALGELPHHRLMAGQTEAAARLLFDLFFLEATAEAGRVFELAGDLETVAAALPAGDDRRRALALLDEGVRGDLQFLARHPTALFQCLWNSCWWHDCPEAAKHTEPPDGGWPAEGPPWERPLLSPLLQRWRGEKEAAQPGFVWVRSLRPPRNPPGTARRMEFRGHTGGVSCLALSPDGGRLASGCGAMAGWEPAARVWDVRRGEALAQLPTASGGVAAVVFSPDGQFLATAGALAHATVQLWDLSTGRDVHTLPSTGVALNDVAFSADGRQLMAADWHTVLAWDAESGELVAEYGCGSREVIALGWTRAGLRTACLSDFGQAVRVCEAESGEEVACVRNDDASWAAGTTFSPDGEALLAPQDGAWGWCPLVGGGSGRSSNVSAFDSLSAAVSADGRLLAVGEWLSVRVLEWGTAKEVFRAETVASVRSLCFSADGRLLAAGCVDGTVRIWDVTAGQEFRRLDRDPSDYYGSAVTALAFSPDGGTLVAGTNWLTVWDVAAGSKRLGVGGGHGRPISALLFSPDGGRCFSAAKEMEVVEWDTASWAEVSRLRTHQRSVLRFVPSPDGPRVLAGADFGTSEADGVFRLCDPATGQDLACFRGHHGPPLCVAVSPDRRLLATGAGDGTVRVWRADDGSLAAGPFAHPSGAVRAVAFSPSGERLASGGDDGIVRVWDVERGQEVKVIPGKFAGVLSLLFLPDGHRLAGGCGDGGIRVWDLDQADRASASRDETAPLTRVAVDNGGSRVVTVEGFPFASPGSAMETLSRYLPTLPDDAREQAPDVAKVWGVTAGTVRRRLALAHPEVTAMALAPHGLVAAFGFPDGTVSVLDTTTGAERVRLTAAGENYHPSAFRYAGEAASAVGVVSLAFSADGVRLAAGTGDGWVQVWDWQLGKEVHGFRAASGGAVVTFSPDGSRVLTGCLRPPQPFENRGFAIGVWQLDAESVDELAYPLPPAAVTAVVALDSRRVFAAGATADGRSLLAGWETGGAAQFWYGTMPGTPRGLRVTGVGRVLVEAVGGEPVLWGGLQANGRADVRAFDADVSLAPVRFGPLDGPVSSLAVSPDGRLLAAGSGRSVHVWGTDGRSTACLAHTGAVVGVSWFPDGRRVLSACADGTLRVWEAATGAEVLRFGDTGGPVTGVALSLDGGRVASASEGDTVALWDASTGARLASLTAAGDTVEGVTFSPDGVRLAAGGLDAVWVWDTRDGTLVGHFPLEGFFGGMMARRTAVQFAPDGARLAVATLDPFPTGIHVFDAATGETLSWVSPHGESMGGFAWSADGRWLLAGGAEYLQVCAANERGLQRGAGADLHAHAARVTSVAASADGRVAAGFEDGAVLVWELWEQATVLGRAWCRGTETVFESAGEWAHFPDAPDLLTRDSSGRRWAGASREHLYLLQLEGAVPAESPPSDQPKVFEHDGDAGGERVSGVESGV